MQALEASPRSVKGARRWAAEAFRELGREDLVDSAELGISELVTNALLHGAPPISVRLRGTVRHPRIEVFDASPEPPRPNARVGQADDLLATFGRGLGMVAMNSHAWGADLLEDGAGKVVWFEPTAEPVEDPDLTGQVFTRPAAPATTPPPGELGPPIRFRQFPVDVFRDWSQHFSDLRRELRLLALAHEDEYPLARTVTELFMRSDRELRTAPGNEELNRAVSEGLDTVDLEFRFRTDAPELLVQLADVLDLADAFSRDQRLLSLAVTPQQLAFRQWFVGEVLRQSNGMEPRAWPHGSVDAQEPSDRRAR